MARQENTSGLTETQISQFIRDGYVRIDNAFPRRLATMGRNRMWRDIDANPNDSSTWTKPVVRLFVYSQKPFREAANTPVLHKAFDQLVGRGRWKPRTSLGTFVVRFPADEMPSDTGWHVDASFPGPEFAGVPNEQTDFSKWRVNINSRGRALLMLFLFSDVSEHDAPTRIRVGSHLDMARLLVTAGEAGMGRDLDVRVSEGRPEALATGKAGTVYLCHPFLVHAAQSHHGTTPRFLAQPDLPPAEPFSLNRTDDDYSPVEIAIRNAIGK
ncbi:MAG: phytanoyl-CoA dioxygenase family protein [Cytophagales bacterium]|nr:phytanoyl-CoA dioxygenase family protein [Cytophagales bacterium]